MLPTFCIPIETTNDHRIIANITNQIERRTREETPKTATISIPDWSKRDSTKTRTLEEEQEGTTTLFERFLYALPISHSHPLPLLCP